MDSKEILEKLPRVYMSLEMSFTHTRFKDASREAGQGRTAWYFKHRSYQLSHS